MGSLFAGILAFLVQSISNKDRRAIVIHGSVISLYLALLFKKYMTGRIGNFLVLLVVCSLVLELDNCLRLDYLQMAWDYLVSSGLPGKENLFFHSFVICISSNILMSNCTDFLGNKSPFFQVFSSSYQPYGVQAD
jgi:hypothetical protein